MDLGKTGAIGVESDYSRSVIFIVGVCGKCIVSGKIVLHRKFRLLESNGVESGAVMARV